MDGPLAPHATIPVSPDVLHFGTPIAVVRCLPADGTTNLAATSSYWATGSSRTPKRPVAKLVVHARPAILTTDRSRIDVDVWSPLLYVFPRYFGNGRRWGRSFRARH